MDHKHLLERGMHTTPGLQIGLSHSRLVLGCPLSTTAGQLTENVLKPMFRTNDPNTAK